MKNLPLIYLDAKPPKLKVIHVRRVTNTLQGGKLYVLDFIEDNTRRLVYPEQPYEASSKGQKAYCLIVGAWEVKDVIVFDAFGLISNQFLSLIFHSAIWILRILGGFGP